MAITKSFIEHTMLKAQDLNELATQANGYVHEVDLKKPDTVDISNYISEGDELPLGCYYVYYGNPTHTLAGRYTYTDTYFIAVCISHWEHAHTLAIYTKNSQNQYIYYETFRTDQASTAFEKYIASLFAGAPATYQQDGLMSASDKQAFDKLQDNISEETTQSEAEEIRFETDGGTLIGKIDSTGADFINLKRNGYQVATVAQIPGIDTSIGDSPSQIKVPTTKAVKDYVDEHGGGVGDLPISEETTQSEDEEFVASNDAGTDTYAKVGSYGVKAKAYKKLNGDDAIPPLDTTISDNPSNSHTPSTLAVKTYVDAHSGGDYPIDTETTQSEDEEISFTDDAKSEAYANVGSYGLKAKAYLDMQGNDLSNILKRICGGNLEKRRIAVKNKDKTLKVLFLGNSYAERSTRLLPQLMTNIGYDIVIGVSYIGGASLDTYYNQLTNNGTGTYKKYKNGSWTSVENTIMAKLLDEDWDYISLQQASANAPSYSTYSHFEDDANLVFAKAPTIEYLQGWLMPWAWADAYLEDHTPSGGATTNATMFSQLASATEDLMDDYGNRINIFCPVGTAVENLTTIYTQQEVYYDNGGDGTHAGLLGCFAGTCVLFEQIVSHFTGKHLSDVTHTTALQNEGVTATILTDCKSAALAAINSPYEVTDLSNN